MSALEIFPNHQFPRHCSSVGDNCGELKYALGALSYRVANEALPPQDAKTEFMEYCDDSWLAIDEVPNPELVQAA